MPATKGVAIQPTAIPPIILPLISLTPLTNPIPSTAPTTTCVLDTGTSGKGGNPNQIRKLENEADENKNSTKAWASTTTRAASGVRARIPRPTVCITLWLYVKMPTEMAIPPIRKRICTPSSTKRPKFNSMFGAEATKTPITLAMLLAPRL